MSGLRGRPVAVVPFAGSRQVRHDGNGSNGSFGGPSIGASSRHRGFADAAARPACIYPVIIALCSVTAFVTLPDYISARRKSATTIELAGPSRRLTGRDFTRGGVQMYVHNTSRRRGSSALAVVGGCLGVYVVLAMAFHWFAEPSAAKSRAVAPYQPPPAAVMQAATPVAPPAPPARLAATSATPATDASAPAEPADKPADATSKKPARQQAARHEPPARVWNPVGSPNGW
jgi:hypothetical protein